MENGLDIYPVAKSHCHEPRFSRKTPRSGWFLENPVSFHFGFTLSLLFACFLFPRFEFCLSHPRCQRPFPQNSLLSVHSLFETVCGHGSFDELFDRIWQRFIYLSNLKIWTFHFLREIIAACKETRRWYDRKRLC